jgi:hypothetical protein
MEGSVTYSGPLPCTQRGHVLGAAVLLVFNEDLLPPPEGLGTSAAQFGVVTGDQLFAGITDLLPPSTDDTVQCPPAGGTVTVSSRWSIGPLPAGRWQVRGFYDYDGDFSPILKIHQLPTAGDIGGGAIANLTEALAGQPVRYQTIEVGVPDPDGKKAASGQPLLVMPAGGAQIQNITVTLGQPLALARPLFHLKGVLDARPTSAVHEGMTVTAPPLTPVTDPQHVVLAQDERFLTAPTAEPATADKAFLRMVLGAGLPADGSPTETDTGIAAPYFLQAQPPYNKLWVYADTDATGAVKTIPETPSSLPGNKIASVFPQAIFARLDESDATLQTAQPYPAVILNGLVFNGGSLLNTLVGAFRTADGSIKAPQPYDQLTVALRPSVICLDPADVSHTVYVVTPRLNAIDGEAIVLPDVTAAEVRRQLGNRPSVKVIEGCLPLGKYQGTLVYGTGQAWTMPNEAGLCVHGERLEGGRCLQGDASRLPLPSQAGSLEIGQEREAGFCAQAFPGPDFVGGVPRVCLAPDKGGYARGEWPSP